MSGNDGRDLGYRVRNNADFLGKQVTSSAKQRLIPVTSSKGGFFKNNTMLFWQTTQLTWFHSLAWSSRKMRKRMGLQVLGCDKTRSWSTLFIMHTAALYLVSIAELGWLGKNS
jgi:hypothetical protein